MIDVIELQRANVTETTSSALAIPIMREYIALEPHSLLAIHLNIALLIFRSPSTSVLPYFFSIVLSVLAEVFERLLRRFSRLPVHRR